MISGIFLNYGMYLKGSFKGSIRVSIRVHYELRKIPQNYRRIPNMISGIKGYWSLCDPELAAVLLGIGEVRVKFLNCLT